MNCPFYDFFKNVMSFEVALRLEFNVNEIRTTRHSQYHKINGHKGLTHTFDIIKLFSV